MYFTIIKNGVFVYKEKQKGRRMKKERKNRKS